jgi:hypothetical protein
MNEAREREVSQIVSQDQASAAEADQRFSLHNGAMDAAGRFSAGFKNERKFGGLNVTLPLNTDDAAIEAGRKAAAFYGQTNDAVNGFASGVKSGAQFAGDVLRD